MKLGVVSDTHDNANYVEAAVELFAGEVDAVIHCGDAVAPFSVTPFEDSFDFYYVRGNNDGEAALVSTVEEFGTHVGECGDLQFGETRVAAYHGTSEAIVEALVASGTYDYVVRGHTHERVHEERDGTTHLNPGGIPIPGAEADPAGVVIDTETGDTRFEPLG